MTGGDPFHLRPGQWADDTAMTLALADSLLHRRTLALHDLLSRFIAWRRDGRYSCTGTCFDIGMTMEQDLAYHERAGRFIPSFPGRRQAGNGSLMRLAPVAVFTLQDTHAASRLASQQSRATHPAPECLNVCAHIVQLLREAILGRPDVLRPRT